MEQLYISLPGGLFGAVKMSKIRQLVFPFGWHLIGSKEKMSYTVKVFDSAGVECEYRLFKAIDGQWYQDPGDTQPVLDSTAFAIIEAIERGEALAE